MSAAAAGAASERHRSDETPSPPPLGVAPAPAADDEDPTEAMDDDLPQCKIKRNYSCNLCSFFSQNPRSFLYHSRDVHADKIKIYECSQCLYASKHSQKLQRHINMIHVAGKMKAKKSAVRKPPPPPPVEKREMKPLPYMLQPEVQLDIEEVGDFGDGEVEMKCGLCSFTSKSAALMRRHERVVHLKKRFLRCNKCSYVTHVKARFTKHVKYHSMPMIKCDLCDFRTPYKWNLDRHYKNHCGTGAFQCSKCNFRADIKQSLTVHEVNHHVPAVGISPMIPRRKRNMVGASETNAFESDGIDQDELELLRLEREDIDGNIKAEEMSEDDDEEPDLNADEPIKMEPPRKVSKKSMIGNASYLPYAGEVTTKTAGVPAKTLKCKFCSYKATFNHEIQRHQKRVHNFNRETKRPPPNLIPIQGNPSSPILKIPEIRNKFSVPEEPTPEVDEKEFIEMCKKSSLTPAYTNIVSLIDTADDLDALKVGENYADERAMKSDDDAKPQIDMLKLNNVSFFDNLRQKLENGNREDCVLIKSEDPKEETISHERRNIADRDELVLSGAELSSTRCQHCRQRCKTSQDLMNHLMHCTAFGEALKKQGTELRIPKKEEPEDDTMENRVFVWNDLPQNVEKSEPDDETGEMDDYESNSEGEIAEQPMLLPHPLHSKPVNVGLLVRQPSPGMKKVFKCPHCSFWASTASRFHVHIVGHLNKKPFECSLCNYRSNWRWDITKHIRLKSARDPSHAHATVNMTDETGRRNYSKYNKYLTMMKVHEATAESSGTGRRTRACDATQGTVSEDDILGPIPGPPQLTPAPGVTSAYQAQRASALRPPPPLQAAHPAGAAKRTLWKCKQCFYRNGNKDKVLAHVKTHYTGKVNDAKEENEEEAKSDENENLPAEDSLNLAVHGPFKCGVCQHVSNWKHVIQRHCKLKHNGEVKIEACTEADKGLPSLDGSISNPSALSENAEENREVFACDICPFTTETSGDLTAHKLNHVDRPGSIFKCVVCPFYVPSKTAVLEHMEIHGEDCMDEATSLQIENFDPQELCDRNKGETDEEKRYQCSQCPYVSNSKSQFLYHKQFHRPRDSPFKCLYCSYNVSRRHLLHQHLRVHHMYKAHDPAVQTENADFPDIPQVWVNRNGNLLKMYKCRWCPHINIRRNNIQEHEKMHLEICKIKCPDCSYSCNNPGVMSSHVKVHAGYFGVIRSLVDPTRSDVEQIEELQNANAVVEPEVVLKVDDNDLEHSTPESSYYQSNSTADDEAGLSEDSSFKLIHFCNKCPARFLYKKELRIHLKFHLIKLPFKCEFCTYAARQRPHLLAHLKVHGQEYQEKTASLVDTYMVSPHHIRPRTTVMTKKSESIVGPVWAVVLPEPTQPTQESKPEKKAQAKHSCPRCPATFFKPVALEYHLTLHGGTHQHHCKYCDYTVKTYGNLIKHQLVHERAEGSAIQRSVGSSETEDPDKSPSKRTDPEFGPLMHGSPDFVYPTYVRNGKMREKRYKCHKCPSAFEKRDQYSIHLSLHGAKQKFRCEKCDYSVKYYANYIQHVKKHKQDEDARKDLKSPIKTEEEFSDTSFMPLHSELTMIEKQVLLLERKQKQNRDFTDRKIYYCDLCPYTNYRKDCLDNHERRHFKLSGVRYGYECDHCDYSATQVNILREHTKVHFKPLSKPIAEAYLKTDELELWYAEDGSENIQQPIFRDNGVDGADRFFPPIPDQIVENIEEDKKVFIDPSTWEPVNEHDDVRMEEVNVLKTSEDAEVNESMIEMIEEQFISERPRVKRLRGKNWRCVKCPHAFGKKDQFERHASLHGSNQRYSCDICDYSVKFYTNYVQHMRMHQRHEPDKTIEIKQYVASPNAGSPRSDDKIAVQADDAVKDLEEIIGESADVELFEKNDSTDSSGST